MKKYIKNLHGEPIYIGSHVYYGYHIAIVSAIGRKNIKCKFSATNKSGRMIDHVKTVNVTKFHLPLIHNADVDG